MDTIAARETRTREARMAAPFVRPRTQYRAGQRALVAVASLFRGLLGDEEDGDADVAGDPVAHAAEDQVLGLVAALAAHDHEVGSTALYL